MSGLMFSDEEMGLCPAKARATKSERLEHLQREIDRFEAQRVFDFDELVNKDGIVLKVVSTVESLPHSDHRNEALLGDEQGEQEPFGQWLLKQAGRKDWIAELAKAAKADTRFPKRGNIDAVRHRMRDLGADGNAYEALDDAEAAWLKTACNGNDAARY